MAHVDIERFLDGQWKHIKSLTPTERIETLKAIDAVGRLILHHIILKEDGGAFVRESQISVEDSRGFDFDNFDLGLAQLSTEFNSDTQLRPGQPWENEIIDYRHQSLRQILPERREIRATLVQD